MNAIKQASFFFLTMICLSCSSQNSSTYWEVSNIYREDKKPFIGLTNVYMQEIYDYNFNFIKRNDSLFFELPEKFNVSLKDFKSLRQLQITDKDYYKMYDFKFSGNSFVVKFKDNATMSESKNTILEFKKISKTAFEKNISDAIAQKNKIENSITGFKSGLDKSPRINLNATEKLPLKNEIIADDKGNEISLSLPASITIKESGDIKNARFSNIRIGTIKDNSKIYDIEQTDNEADSKELSLWVSTDTADFKIDDYIAEHPNFKVYKKENNSIIGYDIGYDFESEKAVINSIFILKYFKVKATHIFIYADIYTSKFSDSPGDNKDMNRIVNFNYNVSENITVK